MQLHTNPAENANTVTSWQQGTDFQKILRRT